MYAVIGVTPAATAAVGWRVVEELLTRVTGDEIAFVVTDPEAVAGYRNRNVDVRRAEGSTPDDAEVVLLVHEPAPGVHEHALREHVAAAVDRAVAAVEARGPGGAVEVVEVGSP